MKKRFLAMLLIIAIMVTMLVIPAVAANPEPDAEPQAVACPSCRVGLMHDTVKSERWVNAGAPPVVCTHGKNGFDHLFNFVRTYTSACNRCTYRYEYEKVIYSEYRCLATRKI